MKALDVFVGGVRVGLLERIDEFEHRFLFDEAWLAHPAPPILGQVFEDRKPEPIATTGQMPLWFEHLLPPEKGPLRRAFARQVNLAADDGFDLLWHSGADLPGAVILTPGEPSLRPAPGSPVDATSAPRPVGFRLSFAGQQWKLSVREGERGLVVPVEGDESSWMAKFHDPSYPELPRVEYATMRWACLSGIEVPRLRLGRAADFERLPEGTPTGDGTVYLIERFDRRPGRARVHMEDFAQVLDRVNPYGSRAEHLAVVVAELCPQGLRALCERLAFCAVCGNGDGHLKNWSLLYSDGRSATLSPAYDIIATVLYPAVDDWLALSLGGSDRFESVSGASFDGVARVAKAAAAEVRGWAEDAARRARQAWSDHRDELPFTPTERLRLEWHLARVPLGR